MALVATPTSFASITPYPLCWPPGWPRTLRRFPAKRRLSFRVVREQLLEVLYRLGAEDVLISCDLPLHDRAFTGLRIERPNDPGVAVYFRLLEGAWVLPCDHWESVRANIQGISQTLEALETLAHAGINEALLRALRGFAASLEETSPPPSPLPRRPLLRRRAMVTPAPVATAEPEDITPWLRLLGLQPEFSREQLEEAYWHLRHAYHPDRGGDVEIFQGLRDARRRAMAYLRERGADTPQQG